MDKKQLENLRSRADAKLRFSEIYLEILETMSKPSGRDIDRAHQESFLYHLLGAKDAFVQELNIYYDTKLDQSSVSPGAIRNELMKNCLKSNELSEIYTLENDSSSWLFHAKEMRDHSTHVAGVPRSFYVGGENDGAVHLINPTTSEEVDNHFVHEFRNWHSNMCELLDRLRISAIETNRK